MKIMRVGVDLAKNVFQVHGVDRTEKLVWRRRLSREKWLKALLKKVEPGCEIGMEACGGAHHWARQLQAQGFTDTNRIVGRLIASHTASASFASFLLLFTYGFTNWAAIILTVSPCSWSRRAQ